MAKSNDGFIIVASIQHVYLQSALMAAESIIDYFPDAKITLFTHAEWVDGSFDETIFDQIITEDFPQSRRAKLWALSKSPYDRTMYVDADAQIVSEEISEAFNQLKESDHMVMGLVRPYAAAIAKFPAGELTLHCGMFTYRKSDVLYKLFDRWFELWEEQQIVWEYNPEQYPRILQNFDIFTFWRLLNEEGWDQHINIGIWEEDARWNFHGYREEELNGKEPIVYHNTITEGKDDERNIPRKSYYTPKTN